MTLDDGTMTQINGRVEPKAPSGRDWPETVGIDLSDEVAQVVTQYVDGKTPFTAHLVTRTLRQAYSDVEIDHDEVKALINAFDFEPYDYVRERSRKLAGHPYIYLYVGG